jgi:Flp pilus assembly protein TadB
VLMLITLIPFPIPIGIDSESRGLPLRPFVYYAAEDMIAVDCLQDREFRVRLNIRYETSIAFRNMFVHLTLWWFFGICVYVGCLSAIIWTVQFPIAFGLSLGVLFTFIIIWALLSCLWVQHCVRQQARHERDLSCDTNV